MGEDQGSGDKERAVTATSATASNPSRADASQVSLSSDISKLETAPGDTPGIAAVAASAAVARATGNTPLSAVQTALDPLPESPLAAASSQNIAGKDVQPEPNPSVSSLPQAVAPAPMIAAQAALAAETLALEYSANLTATAAHVAPEPTPESASEPEAKSLALQQSTKSQVQVPAPTLAARTAQAAIARAKAYDASRAYDASNANDAAISSIAATPGLPVGDAVAIVPTSGLAPDPAPSRTQLLQIGLAKLPAALSDAIADLAATAPRSTAAPIEQIAQAEMSSAGVQITPTRAATIVADETVPPAAPAFTPALSVVAIAPPRRAAASADRIDYTASFLRSPEPQSKLPPPQAQPHLLPSSPQSAPPPLHSEIKTSKTVAAVATAPTTISATATTLASATALGHQLTGAVSIGRDIALRPVPDRANRQRRPAASARPRGAFWRHGLAWARKLFKIAAFAAVGYGVLCVALIFVYRFVDPPTSNLMLWQRLTGTTPLREWVALDKISPNLIKAVIASEDARFCYHGGVDFKALGFALRQTGKRYGRGASTISMQVTKNLFLWNSRSYVRKAIEIPMTLLMELIWPKWRVLEVYLNIAEWGEGVFGAQAASAYHFSKPARRLSPRQAALLVVLLPNPVSREAGDPSRATRRRAARIEKRVKGSANVANCVLN